MNDRFKFRAYDKKNNILVYCWGEATEEQRRLYETIYGKDETYNCWQCCQLDCLDDYGDDFIIEQCTGLKDKNGRLIYENDIVRVDGYDTDLSVMVDGYGCWCICPKGNPIKGSVEWNDVVKECFYDDDNISVEVIGNIHENPELLEG